MSRANAHSRTHESRRAAQISPGRSGRTVEIQIVGWICARDGFSGEHCLSLTGVRSAPTIHAPPTPAVSESVRELRSRRAGRAAQGHHATQEQMAANLGVYRSRT